jgi:Ser/Thr protein kinase RdoA (MazF antagonist)
MPRTKNEVLTIRTTAEVKALLKLAAERERRSAASMVEVLVLEYAKAHGLTVPDPDRPARKGSTKAKNER